MIALGIDLAIDLDVVDALDDLMVLIPLIMIAIALCLAFAVRIVFSWRGVSRMRGDDPYFFAVGDAPTLPHLAIPTSSSHPSVGALRRIESGGCPKVSRSGTAAAFTPSEGERHV